MTTPLFLALISVSASVAAQFCFKWGVRANGADRTYDSGLHAVASLLLQPGVVIGLSLYALGAVLWLYVLSHWEVSKAYPLVGIGFALTSGIGYLIGENVTFTRIVGTLLICAGVVVVTRS